MKIKNNTKEEDDSFDNRYLKVSNLPMVTNVYHVYLTDQIASSKYYRSLYNLLRRSGSEDIFIFYLNNRGGSVETTLEILSAIRSSKSTIYGHITGPIYSAASIIALSLDHVKIDDDTFIMFHDYSSGSFGKGSEQEAAIKTEKPWFDRIFKKAVKGFLTTKETKEILHGKDLYISAKDARIRLKKLGKLV